MDALKLGFDVRSDGYNIFVAGEVGTGRSTSVKQILTEMDKGEHAPEDLVYVHNFKDPDCPRLLAFPAGQGRAFRKAMDDAIERLPKSLVELFERLESVMTDIGVDYEYIFVDDGSVSLTVSQSPL